MTAGICGPVLLPLFFPFPIGMIRPHDNHPIVFVSNVLNGTVTRLNLTISGNDVDVQSATEIAGGYNFTTNPTALVLGPTSLAYDAQTGTLRPPWTSAALIPRSSPLIRQVLRAHGARGEEGSRCESGAGPPL
jgi:hypothetical protein